MYLLDTDVLIDIQRGHQPAIAWFTSLQEVPSVPGFVVKAVRQPSGVAKSESLRVTFKSF